MKTIKRSIWVSAIGLALSITILLAGGCAKGNVPNSSKDEIESAKFDAEKAENPTPMGSAIPPD